MEIKSYADAVYHVKRGFLIIGLTGRTGSGCSTSARILTHKDKPEMPGYEAISCLQPHDQGQRIHQKLKRSWQSLPWNPFVPIEVSKIIFVMGDVHKFISYLPISIETIGNEVRDILDHVEYLKVSRQ